MITRTRARTLAARSSRSVFRRPARFPAWIPAPLRAAVLAALLTLLLIHAGGILEPQAGMARAATIEEMKAYLAQELAAASSIEERLAVLLAEELSGLTAEGIGPGSGGTGLHGDCGTAGGMLTEQTVIDFWKANITAIGELAEELDTSGYNMAQVVAAIHAYGLTRDKALDGFSASLQETLANAAAVARRAILARDHDVGDDRQGCVDLRSAVAGMVARAGMRAFSEGQKAALASLGDGTAQDWADALHRAEREMLESDAMKGRDAFEAAWLIDEEALAVDSADQQRQTFLIDALASPAPVPKVPDGMADTAAGLAAREALMRASALSGIAGAALRRVAALHVPQPALVDAVEELDAQAGSGDALEKRTGADGAGYSWLQLVEARRRFLVSPNMAEDFGAAGEGEGATALAAASAVEVNRRLYRVLAADFALALENFRGELHDTVLLAALAGAASARGSAEAARLLATPRR